MKKLSKVLVLVLSTIMVLAMSASVFADELPEGTAGADKTITITTPDGLADDDEVVYTVYQVFAATPGNSGISYKLLDGVTAVPDGFIVDDGGNVYLGTASTTKPTDPTAIETMVGGVKTYIIPQTTDLTQAQIEAIKAYTAKVEVGTVTITGPEKSKTVTVPNYGYFYITTTTGTLVSIDSTNKSATVEDKNSIPEVDKKITGASYYDEDGKKALAEVGTTVEYEATITVAKGAQNYVFHDTMGTGLSFDGNDSVTVTADPAITGNNWYTIKATPDQGDTLTITFADGIAEGTEITIKYTATVTSDALQDNPAKNTATISYGDNNRYTSEPVETEVYNAKISVVKNDGSGEPLAGAGFVLKNDDDKYYTLANGVVTWVNTEAAADEHMSDAQGAVPAFTGLADGTYTLIEKTVPDGYNKAADTTFEVVGGDYSAANLKQTATVVNNAGSVLPGTGGIGTTIFYILGSLLVIGCGIVLVSRKRMQNNK